MTMVWNAADKGADVVLTNTDHTAAQTAIGSTEYVVSTPAVAVSGGGKLYAEFDITNIDDLFAIAAADNTYVQPGGINTTQSFVVVNNGFFAAWGSTNSGSAFGPGPLTVDFAARLDLTPPRFYFRVNNGAWCASGDPVNGTGGIAAGMDISAQSLRFALSMKRTTASPTVTVHASSFTRTPPTGFTAWDPIGDTGWATTEATDAFAATGYPGTFGVLGDFTTVEAPDIFAAVGYQPASGTWGSVEASDAFSAYVRLPLTGVLTLTESPDVFSAHGLGQGEDGTWVSTEASDIFAALGFTPNSGIFVTTEAADRFSAIGAGVTRVRRRRSLLVT